MHRDMLTTDTHTHKCMHTHACMNTCTHMDKVTIDKCASAMCTKTFQKQVSTNTVCFASLVLLYAYLKTNRPLALCSATVVWVLTIRLWMVMGAQSCPVISANFLVLVMDFPTTFPW